ncbi:MAG: hypothetical protein ACOYXT_23940 [Bacteroidota bacterium]
MSENNNGIKSMHKSKWAFAFLLFISIGTLSCNRDGKTSKREDDLKSVEYYILDFKNLPENVRSSLFSKEFVGFDLSEHDIITSELLLKSQIAKFNENAPSRIELEKYGRQYVGVKSPAGEIIVYINCFCNPNEFSDKKKTLIKVFDGGVCYFELKINLSKGKIFDFATNGSA